MMLPSIEDAWSENFAGWIPSKTWPGESKPGCRSIPFSDIPPYPSNDREMCVALTAFQRTLDAMIPWTEWAWVVVHTWMKAESVRPRFDHPMVLDLFAPTVPEFWRTDDMAVDPGFESPIQSYTLRVTATDPRVLRLVELVFVDHVDDVLVVESDARFVIAPSNGNISVYTSKFGDLVDDRLSELD
jgi:hypothetical protein